MCLRLFVQLQFILVLLTHAKGTWDPALTAVHVNWEVRKSSRVSIVVNVLFSHNITRHAGQSHVLLTCAGVSKISLRAHLATVCGPVVLFRTDEFHIDTDCAAPPASCHVDFNIGDGVITSSWTGSPVIEPDKLVIDNPCFSSNSVGLINGARVFCELVCGREYMGISSAPDTRPTPIVFNLDDNVIQSDSWVTVKPSTPWTEFTELDVASGSGVEGIPGLSDILNMASVF